MVEGSRWPFQIIEIGIIHVVPHRQLRNNESATIMASNTALVHAPRHAVYAVHPLTSGVSQDCMTITASDHLLISKTVL